MEDLVPWKRGRKENTMSKEFYIKQIETIGQYLIDNAEALLDNMDTQKIRQMTLLSTIEPGSMPTVTVQKEYIPIEVMNND